MPVPEALPVIARHILRFNHQSKIPFQTTAKSLYHQTTAQARAQRVGWGLGWGLGAEAQVSISARIAASKGDRERILKSIERAREGRVGAARSEGGGGLGEGDLGQVWEEQVYPPVGGWLV